MKYVDIYITGLINQNETTGAIFQPTNKQSQPFELTQIQFDIFAWVESIQPQVNKITWVHHKKTDHYCTKSQFEYKGYFNGQLTTFYSDATIPRQFAKSFDKPISIDIYQHDEKYYIHHRELLNQLEQVTIHEQ